MHVRKAIKNKQNITTVSTYEKFSRQVELDVAKNMQYRSRIGKILDEYNDVAISALLYLHCTLCNLTF